MDRIASGWKKRAKAWRAMLQSHTMRMLIAAENLAQLLDGAYVGLQRRGQSRLNAARGPWSRLSYGGHVTAQIVAYSIITSLFPCIMASMFPLEKHWGLWFVHSSSPPKQAAVQAHGAVVLTRHDQPVGQQGQEEAGAGATPAPDDIPGVLQAGSDGGSTATADRRHVD